MIDTYKSASWLGKLFLWVSVAIFAAALVIYVIEVRSALTMSPTSFNCLHDSMMKQVCQDPYGSSVSWALLLLVVVCWPALILWAAIAIALIVRRHATKKRVSPKVS